MLSINRIFVDSASYRCNLAANNNRYTFFVFSDCCVTLVATPYISLHPKLEIHKYIFFLLTWGPVKGISLHHRLEIQNLNFFNIRVGPKCHISLHQELEIHNFFF